MDIGNVLKSARHIVLLSFLCFGLGVIDAPPAHAFHFPWDQGHDTTDWDDPPPDGPCEGPLCDPCSATGSPVYIPTGQFFWRDKDIDIFGRQKLTMNRSYNSNDPRDGIFGNGWTSGCEQALYKTVKSEGASIGTTKYLLRLEDGKRYEYIQNEDGSITTPAGRYETLTQLVDGTLRLVGKDGSSRTYSTTGKLLTHTDRNGQSLIYTYDNNDLLVKINDDYDRYIDFFYNSSGRVSNITDLTGRTWSYEYDINGSLVGVLNPLGGRKQYEYTPYTRPEDNVTYYHLTRVIDESGVVLTTVTYNNEKVSSYSELARTYSIGYDLSNKTVTKTDNTGSSWRFTYNDDQIIVREVDPNNYTVTSSYNTNGNLVRTVDEEGKAWLATYDAVGRPLTETDPLGNAITWEYSSTYDWPIKMTSPSGRITKMIRDVKGNLTSFIDPTGATTTNIWSADGILERSVDALGNETVYTSDSFGRRVTVTDPLGRISRQGYDSLSRVISETDPDGNVTSYEYDLLGRLSNTTDRIGQTVNYEYDVAGRLTKFTDARGNENNYSYDAYGRLTARTDPDGRTTTRSYNVDNTLASVTNPDNTNITYIYDAAKRLQSKTVGSETYTYSRNGRGQLTRTENSSGVLTRQYDAAGQVVGESLNGVSMTISLNSDGERTQITALGGTTQYQRSSSGQIASIVDDTGTYQFTYDSKGFRTGLSYPNATNVSYTLDGDNQVTNISHSGVFNDVRSYEYDNVGNIVRSDVNGVVRSYTYDEVERVTNANYSSDIFSYIYDAAGNITSDGRVYDSSNRLIEDSNRTFTYNNRGNLLSKADKTTGARVVYEWDSQNQLTRVSKYPDGTATTPDNVVEYAYGPLGRRTSKTVNGVMTRYFYDGFNRVGTLDEAGTVQSRVIFGPEIDEPLGATTSGGNKYFYADRQKSIIAVSGDTSVDRLNSYSPYGELLNGTIGNVDFGYTGREMDDSDLYFYRTRYYDPTTQRFLSEDPIKLLGGPNYYAYVGGNPIKNTDALGLQIGSPSWCRRQAERIRNIEKNIDRRIRDLKTDKDMLPESCPGDALKPSLSRSGHRKLINMDKANLAAQSALYQAYCQNNPPPPPVPATDTETNPNPDSGVDWETVAIVVGTVIVIGAIIYFSGGLAAPAFTSDENKKTNFESINKQDIMEKLVNLDIESWRYKWENKDVKHVGPMAQDFRKVFGLGKSDKSIDYVDTNGILYAAFQAMYEEMKKKEQRLIELEKQIQQQSEELDKLKKSME